MKNNAAKWLAMGAVAIALLVLALPYVNHKEKEAPFSGLFLAMQDDTVSWIELRQQEQNVTCVWHRIGVGMRGGAQEQETFFTGKADGQRLDMRVDEKPGVSNDLTLAAVKEGEAIIMTLRVGPRAIFTAKYHPSTQPQVDAAAASLREKKPPARKDKAQSANPPPELLEDVHAQENKKER